jgi:hypothetical protein
MQRVLDWLSDLDLKKAAAVKQRFKAHARRDSHVMLAIGADVEGVLQFAVKQHRPAFGAFRPQVLGRFAPREDRVDRRFDVVGDPVHPGACPKLRPEK